MAGQWSAFPPEVNAGQLMAGDNGASIAAAAAAYEALAAVLTAEAAKMASTAGVTASTGWQGVGGTAMMATAMPYVAALNLLAAWVHESAAAAAGIEQAYVTAKTGMIPVPACTTNRTTWTGLAMSNFCGINNMPMGVLDGQYFFHFWNNNAAMMGGYEGIVTAILGILATPPPPAPLTANPAGPAGQAAAIGQAAATGATSAAMSQSLNGVTQASGAVQPGASAAASPAQSMASMPMQMMSQLGQLPQMAAQPLQMLGQFPQMLGQMPQMAMGMLGPLSQGMGGGALGGIDKVGQVGGLDQTTLAAATTGGGGGGGGIGGVGSGAGVMSSFTRPTGSFSAPGAPKLPTGWTPNSAVPEAAASASPGAAGGTGGLYGAPAAANAAGHMGRDERGKDGSADGRTMQLTVGPRSGRED
jgi:PPE-repeat protein